MLRRSSWRFGAFVFTAMYFFMPTLHAETPENTLVMANQILEHPAPGAFLAGIAVGGLALVLSLPTAATDIVLAAFSGVLLIAYVVRRHEAWLAASVAALAISGFIAGDHWPPVVAAAAAIASGVRSDHFADQR